MKKGIILLCVAAVLFIVYLPVSLSYCLTEHFDKLKRFSKNQMYGLHLYGQDRKTPIQMAEFLEYDRDNDYINDFTAWLWHANDTLHVEIKGRDGYPSLRRMLASSIDDTVHDMTGEDKIKISVDEGHTHRNHFNYQFSFHGLAFAADNLNGKFVEGSKKVCDFPWSLKADGPDWFFTASVPLHGQKKIGLNLMRKFYGGRDVGLVDGNNPERFFLVNLM